MKSIKRYFHKVAFLYKLAQEMMASLGSLYLLPFLVVNTFAFALLHGTPGAAGIPALNFMLLIFWLPQLFAALVNAFTSDGLVEIPLKPGKDLHMTIEPRKTNTKPNGSMRIAVQIDTPPAELWGKTTEAELLLVLQSSASVTPTTQVVYLAKNEPTTPVYFEVRTPDEESHRWVLSVYYVSPISRVTLLAQHVGRVASMHK